MPEAKFQKSRRFLFLLASSRRGGNSETLARRAAQSLDRRIEQRWIRLMDHPLPPFVDVRHEGDGSYPVPERNGETLLQATLDATDIIFVAPLYWYGLPTLAKHLLDHLSGWMRVPGVDFAARMAGKQVWAITALSDEDYSVAGPLLDTLKLSAAYLKMEWGGTLLGFGNRPDDVLDDEEALCRAGRFFAPRSMSDTAEVAHD